MRLPALNSLNDQHNQYLFFRFLFDIANAVTWGFYIILLLRSSNNSIEVVFLNAGGYNTGILLGFFLSSFLISRLGYMGSYRLSNLLLFLCTLLTLVTLPYILELHILLAILRGIAKAFFFAPSNMYNLKEVHGGQRSSLLNLVISVDYIIGIVLPAIVGGSIVAYGYTWIFVVGMLLYLAGTVYKWGSNKIPHDSLNFAELRPIFHKRGFKRWSALVVFAEFLAELQINSLAIIPFLFLGNEFNVGVFASVMGFIAAFTTFTHRHDRFQHKLHLGYIGAVILGLGNLIFAVVWTVPALFVRGLISTLGISMFDPPAQEIGYRNKESILGSFMSKSAVEIDLYLEVLYYVARMPAIILVSVLVLHFRTEAGVTLQAIILGTSFAGVLILWLNVWVNRILRGKGITQESVAGPLAVSRI